MSKFDGEVKIRLDKMRTLKFGFRGNYAFQSKRGRSVENVLAEFYRFVIAHQGDPSGKDLKPEDISAAEKIIGFDTLVDLLWAALLHEDENLTVGAAADMMDYADGETLAQKFVSVFAKVQEAAMLAFRRPKGEEVKEEKKVDSPVASGTGN